MSFRDLHSFVDMLDQRGELRRLPALDANTPLMDAIQPNGDSATLFEANEGSAFSLVTGLFATEARAALALGVSDLDQLRVRVGRLLSFASGSGDGLMSSMGDLMDVFKSVAFPVPPPRNPPVRQVIHRDSVDLTQIPFPLIHAQDSHRSLTGAIMIWESPHPTEQHIESGRIALDGSDRILVGVPSLIASVDDAGLQFPVTIIIGGSLAILWSGGVPLPSRLDRFFIASWLQGKPTAMSPGVDHDFQIPAHAECVIEGWAAFERGETAMGEFVEASGKLIAQRMAVVRVDAVLHRERSILPIIMPYGGDPRWMLKAGERLFLPLLQLIMSDVSDLSFPTTDVMVVSVHNGRLRDTFSLTYILWGLLPTVSMVIIVDYATNPHDVRVLRRVIDECDGLHDVITGMGGALMSVNATHLTPSPEHAFADEYPTWTARLLSIEAQVSL